MLLTKILLGLLVWVTAASAAPHHHLALRQEAEATPAVVPPEAPTEEAAPAVQTVTDVAPNETTPIAAATSDDIRTPGPISSTSSADPSVSSTGGELTTYGGCVSECEGRGGIMTVCDKKDSDDCKNACVSTST